MLSEELLKQAAEELALALIDSLPKPEQCQHQFSEEFENKMKILLSSIPPDTQKDNIARTSCCLTLYPVKQQ